MHTFKNGLADQKIQAFLSSFVDKDLSKEDPETKSEIFNQLLIEDIKKKENKKSQSWLEKIWRYLFGY
jgi:hypothetical protein